MPYIACDDCGFIFDENELCHYAEENGEELACCPSCGGSIGFSDVEPCVCCGEFAPPDELTEGYCAHCGTDIVRRFTGLLHEHFTREEIGFLNAAYEGEPF